MLNLELFEKHLLIPSRSFRFIVGKMLNGIQTKESLAEWLNSLKITD